jgi:hypothetical protein
MPTRRLTRQLIWQLLLYTLLFGVAVITLKAVVVWRDGQQQMDAIPTTVSDFTCRCWDKVPGMWIFRPCNCNCG